MNTSKFQPQPKSRGMQTINLIVNGLVALAWIAGAVMFASSANPFGREGPAKASWVVIALLVIISLMLISDIWTAYKTRGRSIEAVTGILMWLGFLGGQAYYLTDFSGSNWLGAAAALLVGLSFAVRVIMTIRKAAQPAA